MPKNPIPSRAQSGAARARALPDLRALEAFVTVCEAGSMAVAAQRLGLSQSAVSQCIKTLEHSYGLLLFDRDVRPARPTRAGRALLEQAQELLAHARSVSEHLRGSARQDYAQIRLGCVDSFAATVGPALIQALAGSARQLQLWSGLTPGLSAQLQARELDLAICTESALVDARIVQQALFSEAWVLVLPRKPRTRGRAPLHTLAELKALPAQMGDIPLVRYTQRSVIGQQIERYLRHVGLQAPLRFEFDATDALLSLVAAGLGWAISTPLCLWQSRAWLDQVQVLPLPPSRLGQRDFFLLSHEGEWAGLDETIVRVTRQVLAQHTVPALRKLMPALPPDAILTAPGP
jgi:DNA-binding transcriptional LysR family regulator